MGSKYLLINADSFAQKITLDKERIQIPEILFRPQDIGIEECGISEAIFQSLEVIDEDLRYNFLENIVITGGCSLFDNFIKRLYRELNESSPVWIKPRIYCMK